MALRKLSSVSLNLTASHALQAAPCGRPFRAFRYPSTALSSYHGSGRMGWSFSKYHTAPQAQAQTQFGGDGFRPESTEEYDSLEGIEVFYPKLQHPKQDTKASQGGHYERNTGTALYCKSGGA